MTGYPWGHGSNAIKRRLLAVFVVLGLGTFAIQIGRSQDTISPAGAGDSLPPADTPAAPQPGTPDAGVLPPAAPPLQNVPLKSGDWIRVNVFGEASLSGQFVLGNQGGINFPLLGSLDLASKTPQEAAAEIESLLEKDFIKDAQVSVDLVARPDKTIMVIGAVNRAGQIGYAADKEMDLLTAIASAGGFSQDAITTAIEVKYSKGGQVHSVTANWERDKGSPLSEGATIIVPRKPVILPEVKAPVELEQVTVTGMVRRPGVVEYDKSKSFDILTALAQAGGFAPEARPSKVIVRRSGEGGVQTFTLNIEKMRKNTEAPFLLQPGDAIYVPESIF